MNSLRELIEANAVNGAKPALILGSAPSVKAIKKFSFNGVRIGVGDMPVRAPEFGPYDFWVTANSYYPLTWEETHFTDMQNSAKHTLVATMCPTTSNVSIEKVIDSINTGVRLGFLTVYDQRHFYHESCLPINKLCCILAEKFIDSPSIQEELAALMNSKSPAYGEGSTVTLHGFALAVLLRCNPIFIAGVELPTRIAQYKSYNNWFRHGEKISSKLKRLVIQGSFFLGMKSTDFGIAGRENILMDFDSISTIAHKLGINVFSLSKTSPLNGLNHIQYLKV